MESNCKVEESCATGQFHLEQTCSNFPVTSTIKSVHLVTIHLVWLKQKYRKSPTLLEAIYKCHAFSFVQRPQSAVCLLSMQYCSWTSLSTVLVLTYCRSEECGKSDKARDIAGQRPFLNWWVGLCLLLHLAECLTYCIPSWNLQSSKYTFCP